ncbi:MAG: nucleotidyltransferase family protein [Oscillospiraceae bacterium]|nr:nucleotidyltransferase family protein [Oscillospiraceae bacterium]
MKTVGIICEYNPFHNGHKKQLDTIRAEFGEDCAIVCLMSGNFVQRGYPAIFHKSLRAQAALFSGADLVLELPLTYALSSAEGFAAGGVKILGGFCDLLCFGTETGNAGALISAAKALLSDDFKDALRQQLDKGLSFPAARAAALQDHADLLQRPNDILAVEYCKAILAQNSTVQPYPILRQGDYHGTAADPANPSATAIRNRIRSGESWGSFVPEAAHGIFRNAQIHSLSAGERAVLARLRCMTDAEFEALPYGSEGLWRKFMHACRSQDSIEAIVSETKSKRYTRTRIDRMLMCAYLGITKEMLEQDAPYTRVLALNDKGRSVLKQARICGSFPHVGEVMDDPYWDLEQRAADLYALFCESAPAPAGSETKQRVFFKD